MMPNPQQMINFLINSNPQIQNNPNAQQMLQVVQSGNRTQGEQLADNLCKTYGITREQATQQAQQWLMSMFRR